MQLLDWTLTKYDYLTFVFLLVAVVAFFYVIIQIGALPGKIAERRHHPHADSVKIVGWIGLFTVFPWIHAIIWAYHDSLTIDVRTFPGSRGDVTVKGGSFLGVPATKVTMSKLDHDDVETAAETLTDEAVPETTAPEDNKTSGPEKPEQKA